jgi:hypothetical protein
VVEGLRLAPLPQVREEPVGCRDAAVGEDPIHVGQVLDEVGAHQGFANASLDAEQ